MTIITTGVTSPNGNTPLVARQEIRTFAKDTDLMNLFLLGVQHFQSVPQEDLLSWFQIAGIHGRPYIPYDGVGKAGNFGGYCTHSSILFPPWHRPYLALFEQTLSKYMQEVANDYPNAADKQKYTLAAERFRFPYWDWAANADLPDFISTQQTVSVNTPQGIKTINNPLFAYKFNPMYSNFGDGLPDEKTWEAWQYTVRWPTTTTATGKSNPTAMEANLNNNRLTVRDRTYNLLTQATTYEAFSNDGFLGSQTDPTYFDSLESIHGQIHGMTGRNGHMAVVDYAAFDPVFWMHHCNCDRIFAIWQALNPSQYVIPKKNQAGTFATPPGTLETATSSLEPFRQTATQFWTAIGVRDTRTFNYTYPELAKWASLTQQEKSVRLRTDINTMYGKTAAFAALRPELFSVSAASQPVAAMAAVMPTARVAGTARVAASTTATKAVEVTAAATTATTSAMRKVAEVVPAPVAQHAATAGNLAAGAAQKIMAATPASVASAASNVGDRAHAAISAAATAVIPPVHPATHDQLPTALAAVIPRQGTHSASGSVEITGVDTNAPQDGKHYNEWLANITVEKYAAKKTFFVYIFLGDFNTDSAKWGEDPNLVGTHVVFANNMNFTGCERCRDAAEEHKLVTGTIPLTGALGDRLGKEKLGGLEPAEIIPYLKQHLHWRIEDQEGKVIERNEIQGLKVSVAHVSVAVPDNIARFPTWGQSTKETEVTRGRPGGAEDDD